MGVWLRFREWVADCLGLQYPRQTFIPAQRPLGEQLLPEQRLLLGVVGVIGAITALTLMGLAVFLAYVWVFVPAAKS